MLPLLEIFAFSVSILDTDSVSGNSNLRIFNKGVEGNFLCQRFKIHSLYGWNLNAQWFSALSISQESLGLSPSPSLFSQPSILKVLYSWIWPTAHQNHLGNLCVYWVCKPFLLSHYSLSRAVEELYTASTLCWVLHIIYRWCNVRKRDLQPLGSMQILGHFIRRVRAFADLVIFWVSATISHEYCAMAVFAAWKCAESFVS